MSDCRHIYLLGCHDGVGCGFYLERMDSQMWGRVHLRKEMLRLEAVDSRACETALIRSNLITYENGGVIRVSSDMNYMLPLMLAADAEGRSKETSRFSWII